MPYSMVAYILRDLYVHVADGASLVYTFGFLLCSLDSAQLANSLVGT